MKVWRAFWFNHLEKKKLLLDFFVQKSQKVKARLTLYYTVENIIERTSSIGCPPINYWNMVTVYFADILDNIGPMFLP